MRPETPPPFTTSISPLRSALDNVSSSASPTSLRSCHQKLDSTMATVAPMLQLHNGGASTSPSSPCSDAAISPLNSGALKATKRRCRLSRSPSLRSSPLTDASEVDPPSSLTAPTPAKGSPIAPATLKPSLKDWSPSNGPSRLPAKRPRYPTMDEVVNKLSKRLVISPPSDKGKGKAVDKSHQHRAVTADENNPAQFDIRVSPTKGRRVKVLQIPSQQRATLPSWPKPTEKEHSGLFTDWLDWPPPIVVEDDGEKERRRKKRKRLHVFNPAYPCAPSTLKPAELVGIGRMLLRPSDVTETHPESDPLPKKRRSQKRSIDTDSGPPTVTAFGVDVTMHVRRSPSPTSSDIEDAKEDEKIFQTIMQEGPNWPDTNFPWSQAVRLREEAKMKEEYRKLCRLDSFLDRLTDDGEESDSEPIPMKRRRRRSWGLFLPNSSDPTTSDSSSLPAANPVLFDSSSSDALLSLLSHPQAQALHARQLAAALEDSDSDEGGIVRCLCGSADDEPAMVKCDTCQTWYHQECVLSDDEMGVEGLVWCCEICQMKGIMMGEVDGPRSNVFGERVIDEDVKPDVAVGDGKHPQQNSQWLLSPYKAANASNRPVTPPRRRAPSDCSLPFPFRSGLGGPVTPFGSTRHRIDQFYSTPLFFCDFEPANPGFVMDPTTTPSRGLTFDVPFVQTAIPAGMVMSVADDGDGEDDIPSTNRPMKRERSPSTPVRRSMSLSLRGGSVGGVPGLAFSSSASVDSGGPASPSPSVDTHIRGNGSGSGHARKLSYSDGPVLGGPPVGIVDSSPSPLTRRRRGSKGLKRRRLSSPSSAR